MAASLWNVGFREQADEKGLAYSQLWEASQQENWGFSLKYKKQGIT